MNFKNRKVLGFENIHCQSETNFNASSENNMMMKSAKPIKYNFFQSDDQYLKENGFCVIDIFVGIYGPLIKKLTRDYFIKLCYEVKGINMMTNKNHLDQGIDEDEDEKNNLWKIEDGITPDMIQIICQKLNISHYAFDVTKNVLKTHYRC